MTHQLGYVSIFSSLIIVLFLLSACNKPKTSQIAEQAPAKVTTEEASPDPVISPKTDPVTNTAATASCNGGENLAVPLQQIANNISADSVWYDKDNPQNMADCSGIFHRVIDSLKKRCPDVPIPTKASRSSRSLAAWFHEQGRLTLIQDAAKNADLLKPGAIIFYGGKGAVAAGTLTIEELTKPGGINHVGYIVDVERDASGTLTNYHLFHGQWVGKMASVTKWHKLDPGRANYPPYGNGSEPLVAVANF